MVVTSDCKEKIASFLGGNTETAPTHTAFGTGSATPNEEDTALTTEFNRIAKSDTQINGKEVQITAVMGVLVGNGTTFAELGLFNAGAGGTMFQRSTFANIDKTNTFEIQAVVTIRVE
jgi:hypothetical protein